MDLVDVPRPLQAAAAVHPVIIPPLMTELPYPGGGVGPHLSAEGVGVGLPAPDAVGPLYDIFIQGAFPGLGEKAPPDSAVLSVEEHARIVPAAEVPGDRNAAGVGRPYGELRTVRRGVGAHDSPGVIELPRGKGGELFTAPVHKRPSFAF